MAPPGSHAAPLEVATAGGTLRGERAGEGPVAILVHGLSATRRYVIHGSRALERAGYEVVVYDARGHGESDPAPEGSYDYKRLATDLGAVADLVSPSAPVLLAGHSMGAHTIARFALDQPSRVRAAAFICPAYPGVSAPADELERWDELASALEQGGVDGFIAAYERRPWPEEWRETIMRITRERLGRHRHLAAVADALREVPRSEPFGAIAELGSIEAPALVVGSRDEADPTHPYALAEEWSRALPRAKLVSEQQGDSPLAWQGGKLARELAAFFTDVV